MPGTVNYVDYNQVDTKTRESMDRLFAVSKKSFWIKKRTFDVIVALLAIIVLSPFLMILSLIIFIDDPHESPIFRQTRIGRHGKEFVMYKFRTMVKNAEDLRTQLEGDNEMDGPVFKIKNDPRVTKIGKFLRATSIDEILQLFNILKGDMSFVGPRPPLPAEVAAYNDYQRLRLVVTPGLTCIWQIASDRNDISFADWVEMDMEYILHRTVLTDIKMILKTVWAVIKRYGR